MVSAGISTLRYQSVLRTGGMGSHRSVRPEPSTQESFSQSSGQQGKDPDMKKPYHQVERDMLWFFNHADAAMGFKSSHAAFVAAVYGVSSTNQETDPYTDGLLKQVRKLRHIRNVFFSLPKYVQRALEATYNHECQFRFPPELVTIYGNKAGCALFNQHIQNLEELSKLCRKKISSKLSSQEELVMFNIGVETRQLWDNIHEIYMKQRQLILNQQSAK